MEATRRDMLKKGALAIAGLTTGVTLLPEVAGCRKREEFPRKGEFIASSPWSPGELIETDLLIIGSGFAGLWAAVAARDHGVRDITIVDKASIGKSSKSKMCAGATIYCEPGDDQDAWLKDIAEAQHYLCRQDIVADLLDTSYSRLKKLQSWGVEYGSTPWGSTRLPSRGFRLVKMRLPPKWKGHGGGDAVMGALLEQIKQRDFRFRSKTMITGLIRTDGRVAGAVGFDRISGEPVSFKARAVILSAADCSFRGNYLCVDNVTGDAFSLAYDAGVRLNNMEFLCSNTGPPRYGFEGTGVALKFGGKLINAKKDRFMERYHPDAEVSEVSYIVQAMSDEIIKGNGPPFYLDMTGIVASLFLKNIFKRKTYGMIPLNLDRLEEVGLDITSSPQEWVAAIQTLRGGVHTDRHFASDLPGLFAAGTSQSLGPGLFNGWSTMRAMGSGELAGKAAASFLKDSDDVHPDKEDLQARILQALAPSQRKSGISPDEACARLQQTMFPYTVSVRKSETTLEEALARVVNIRDNAIPALYADSPHELVKAHETKNMVLVAEMSLRSSLERRESRSDHYRADYPKRNNREGLKWIHLEKGPGGQMHLSKEPIPVKAYPFQPDGIQEGQA